MNRQESLTAGRTIPAIAWRKASRSANNGACVEVGVTHSGDIAVRDSKNPGGPRLILTPAAWQQFLTAVSAASSKVA